MLAEAIIRLHSHKNKYLYFINQVVLSYSIAVGLHIFALVKKQVASMNMYKPKPIEERIIELMTRISKVRSELIKLRTQKRLLLKLKRMQEADDLDG